MTPDEIAALRALCAAVESLADRRTGAATYPPIRKLLDDLRTAIPRLLDSVEEQDFRLGKMRERVAELEQDNGKLSRAMLNRDCCGPEISELEAERDALRAEVDRLRETNQIAATDRDQWIAATRELMPQRDSLERKLARAAEALREIVEKGWPDPWAIARNALRDLGVETTPARNSPDGKGRPVSARDELLECFGRNGWHRSVVDAMRAKLDAAIAEAVQAERELCARIVEQSNLYWHNGDPRHRIAAKIRLSGGGEP